MKTFIAAFTLLAVSTSAFALTPKSELSGKQFINADKNCAVSIGKDEFWTIECAQLQKKYRETVLTGQGIDVINCYGEPTCEGIVFKSRYSRPLQAFILKDAQFPGGLALGLVYGSPADGDVETLTQF